MVPVTRVSMPPALSYEGDSLEPWDDDKDVVARAAFYMATRYDGTDADVADLELSDTPKVGSSLTPKSFCSTVESSTA